MLCVSLLVAAATGEDDDDEEALAHSTLCGARYTE